MNIRNRRLPYGMMTLAISLMTIGLSAQTVLPYQDVTLTPEQRADDLI